MKTSRSIMIWAALALCAVMVLAAMTWLTRSVIAADRERVEAEARADLEECTRLALWRMDAAGAAIVSDENSRPVSDWLLEPEDPAVKLYFQQFENGALSGTEPQQGNQLSQLRSLLGEHKIAGDQWQIFSSAVKKSESVWGDVSKEAPIEEASNMQQRKEDVRSRNRIDDTYQSSFNKVEKSKRAQSVSRAVESKKPVAKAVAAAPGIANLGASMEADAFALEEQVAEIPITELGVMRSIWIGEELFLLRQFSKAQSGTLAKGVQGVWLDQQVLKQKLLSEIKDLLPMAELVKAIDPAGDSMALVSFPFRLQQNEHPSAVTLPFNKILILGWGAAVLALCTAAALVFGVMRLSDRRASFVSAVTHELRTPLTTFRLYSDMLEKGAVKEEKRAGYLKVLTREADRLSHLVENVLSFSQIERGSARSVMKEWLVSDLLEPVRERLEERLAAVGMTLEITVADVHRVRADSAIVEHVMFNLIDNAAKYASDSDPAEVHVHVSASGKYALISVQDFGPGIAPSERSRIFRAFHKSAHEAAESRPGVGLGLALSLRLAKSLGGDLSYRESAQGACFVLKLPLAGSH